MAKKHSWWARVEPGSVRPWRRDRIELCAMTEAVGGDRPPSFDDQRRPTAQPVRWALYITSAEIVVEQWLITSARDGYHTHLTRSRIDRVRRYKWADRIAGRPWKGNIDELCDLLASVPVLDSTETGVAS